MKLLSSVAISALCLTAANAVPYDDFEGLNAIADEFQTIMSSGGRMSGKMHNAFDALGETGKNVLKKSKKLFGEAESKAERWVEDGKEFIKQQGTICAFGVFACLYLWALWD